MIGKLKKGASFGGCIRYVTGKDEAKILASDGMKLERKDIEQLPRAGKPAVKEDVARESPCVKRLLQQVDHDSRGFLTCHLLAFM